ncbi:hypothetical protein HMPREF0083_03906 [Aneurinibacillus aneurinilyticus ATCC 12856]|uniref:Uncharacterized protein n=1 Tax=Aneurinibacillus aneurinilyticus ATCC 12856 TaxID=649747 RepID=U1WZ89_ANEAE|nr:hypothetical protein HMPREF0083_03906 [Aneurinibacillus aneurinilyticus ATCC 12856]
MIYLHLKQKSTVSWQSKKTAKLTVLPLLDSIYFKKSIAKKGKLQ